MNILQLCFPVFPQLKLSGNLITGIYQGKIRKFHNQFPVGPCMDYMVIINIWQMWSCNMSKFLEMMFNIPISSCDIVTFNILVIRLSFRGVKDLRPVPRIVNLSWETISCAFSGTIIFCFHSEIDVSFEENFNIVLNSIFSNNIRYWLLYNVDNKI